MNYYQMYRYSTGYNRSYYIINLCTIMPIPVVVWSLLATKLPLQQPTFKVEKQSIIKKRNKKKVILTNYIHIVCVNVNEQQKKKNYEKTTKIGFEIGVFGN